MEEIWKDIYFTDSITGELVDYRGLYQVSNLGRIKSLDRVVNRVRNGKVFSLTIHGKIMQWKYNQHYWMIGLMKNNKARFFLVHRIVAHMYVPNPDNLPEVNHKDENTWNPIVTNLEWCSREQNIIYGTRCLRQGRTISKPVLQYSLEGEFIKKWDSYQDAADYYDISRGDISNCVLGHARSIGGFMWRPLYDKIPMKIDPYVDGRNAPRKQIVQCDLDGNEIKTWKGVVVAATELNLSQSHISSCLSGRGKTAGGYTWRYA